LLVLLTLAFLFAAYSFIGSCFNGDTSFVDRQWSTVPILYAWYCAYRSQFEDQRLLLMASLVTIWGARLTFNFWRKGGYNGMEDYRWEHVRKHWAFRIPLLWPAFNLSFVCLFQHALLLAFTLPSYVALCMGRSVPLGVYDYVASGCYLFFVLFETIADQQQWNFQNEKHRQMKAGTKRQGDYALGFLTHGLFRYSRHPNFFAEQSIWISFYLFSYGLTHDWKHWSGIGALTLVMLFQGSTTLTEQLSKKKYPAYGKYQKTTSRLLPWFGGAPVKAE
jgi:steroid 5-alpha reductase family enzyme